MRLQNKNVKINRNENMLMQTSSESNRVGSGAVPVRFKVYGELGTESAGVLSRIHRPDKDLFA